MTSSSNVSNSGSNSKNYSAADHKQAATHLESAAKLHNEAATHVAASHADKASDSAAQAEIHYTKAGEIDQRYKSAQDLESSAQHYAQAAGHRKDASMHTQYGNHAKANESHAKANEHLTIAGEIDHRFKASADHATAANHYDQASAHRTEAAAHTRNGDHEKAMHSNATANEHLTKAGEIDKRYTKTEASKDASNNSNEEKHPRNENGQFADKD